MKKVNSVEEYFEIHENFSEELRTLRYIINSTELFETLKWGSSVYTINGKNVIGISGFKHHFGIWFFNGVFLKDEHHVLENAQEGKTKALRQWRFTSIKDIDKNLILLYIKEAIENQKLGKEIKADRSKKETVIPEVLLQALDKNPHLASCFKALTPYKQREYCEHIDSAKREATKISRLEKIKPIIHDGIGLNDKYKKC